jgi:gamma-glutamylcyclotransferase (GGCT)/AIG2-like uncharacterized protein YtfP
MIESAVTAPLYFAYGSNLGATQMARRCAGASFFEIGRVTGHRLGFTRESRNWGGGVADLVVDRVSEVWGALYQVTPLHLAALDRAEGVAIGAYERASVAVQTANGQVLEAITYVVVTKLHGLQPSRRYWLAICQGARERSLPTAYVSALERIAYKPDP